MKRPYPRRTKNGRSVILAKKQPKAELATSHKVDAGVGLQVRSEYEKACVALLRRHAISFQYEPLMLLRGRQFRPDFYLPEHNLFVEICGWRHMPQYRSRQREKETMYEEAGLASLFINAASKAEAARLLEEQLRAKDIIK